MKKFTAILAVAFLTVAFGSATVFAHGHSADTGAAAYAACNIENCSQTGPHKHGGTYYKAHSAGDGHEYHGYCDLPGCALTGYHEHDGAYSFGHAAGNGYGGDHATGNRNCR
jgi:hypothetical protein